ncbi:MAG: phosphate ABC transporter ATP-binding protein [Deltaproteobacteria bacterium]|nr:MAG: phosphate ABC transporter ATP-binding protein [Deltaproteobacteria bacterium]
MKEYKIRLEELSFFFGDFQALDQVSLEIRPREIFGLMGPAKSGKSTLLRVLNRMCDLIPEVRVTGRVWLDDEDILSPDCDVVNLRRRVGLVLSKPMPLPRSIRENLVLAPRLAGRERGKMEELVETSLKAAQLWEEVKDRLNDSALKLSGGQQQRLCLARTLAMEPEVILLDEPTSGLDPISTAKIEETLSQLKKHYTIILVSNNTKQIARATDRTAYLLMSRIIEIGDTARIFTIPKDKRTDDYISGRFG